MFYYTITNIHPVLRSRLQTIMLLSVVESKYIEMYGIDEILKPFVSEMMELESVSLYISAFTVCVRVCCVRMRVCCMCVYTSSLNYSLMASHLKYMETHATSGVHLLLLLLIIQQVIWLGDSKIYRQHIANAAIVLQSLKKHKLR